MPIKIPSLPSIPDGTISGKTSIPVSKTNTDPKTYKISLDQTLAWIVANGGGGGGGAGSQGAQGGTGSQGGTGVQGSPGTAGSSGYQGGVGPQGFSGFQGYSGMSGFQGHSGYQGVPGESGYQGFVGPEGFSGFQGYSGMSGFQGHSGYQGVPGESGYQGFVGPQGFSGFQGYSGYQGFEGHSGYQGVPGSPGGDSGYQGFTGAQGFSGFQGYSGFSGFDGQSGYQGAPGESGYQGFVGPQGLTGVSGYQGTQGSMGSNTGQPGPGLVYTGYYRGTSAVYYNSLTRKDVASYDSGSGLVYWLANSTTLTATSGASGYGVPGVDASWANFGQEFKSVATGLLLTEDAAVTKTITLGEVSNLSAGIIRSANCNNFGDGNGFWLGNDVQGRVGFFVGNSAGPSYLAYDSAVGSLALSGTIYATAGKIAGLGITDYSYSGGSSGTVLYTGNPLTPGTSSTPLFINARATGTYGDGEVILGLGDGLVYYYDNGNYYAQLSGTVYANAGSIGGVGISEGIIYTGSPSGAGTSATPFYLNGATTYAPGEVLFSLGNRLVFAVDPGNASLTSLVLSGNITADAGSIGGIGIGSYNNGSSSGSVLYSGNPATPGTSSTPIFINGRTAGTYNNGEVILGLGDGLVYYYNNGNYYAQLSGIVYANAGSIGGVGISEGIIYTGSPTGAGTSATPFYLNGTTSYAPGEILFSLGNRLVFAVDPGDASLTSLVLSGNITADAGSIGGIGIGSYNNGSSSGSVLYSGNPATPGTSSTPIFINGRTAGTYNNGEVILGLGNRLVYYYDNGNYYAQLSGTIYANAGSIGGVGISEGIIYTGSPSGAGTSATPFYLNGTTSYAPGEILFSLGNRLVFGVDPGNASLTSLVLSGNITADAGSIGGIGIGSYNNGTSSGSVLYSGNPATPGTSSTPIFINGRASGTYSDGEVILGLGNRLVYYYDDGNYYAQLSGIIYANAGSIGGVGISEGIIYTGSPSGAGTSATPFYLNGTVSYAPGEILFSLGNRLVFAVDPTATNLTALVLSGNITADAGSIGGIGIGSYDNGTGGKGSVLFSGNSETPGSSSTPIFINGRLAGTYANNEIIFALGRTLTYRYLSAGGGTYSAKIEGEIIADAGSFGGIYIGSGYIYSGNGNYSNPDTPFYVNSSNGRFSLGSALIFDGTTLTISGNVETSATSALSAAINDVNAKIWTDSTGKLVAPSGSSPKSGSGLYLGPQEMGYWNGSTWKTYMDNTGNFYLNGSGANSLLWDGTALTINGSISAIGSNLFAGKSDRSKYIEWNSAAETFTVKGMEAADGITITSSLGLRFSDDAGSFTMTGGTGNGAQYGAQIDLVGNNYNGSGQGGQLVLQAGAGVGSTIALHTNVAVATGAYLGVQRVIVDNDGLVTIKRAPTYLGYNGNAGNLSVDGNIGIGTNPADANVATGNLDATGDITAASFNTTSSRRYKKNIVPLTDSLTTINKLQGVKFDWNNKDITNDIGFIAEDMECVLPTIVHKNPSNPNEIIGLDYGRITAVLVESVKELNKRIEELEKR